MDDLDNAKQCDAILVMLERIKDLQFTMIMDSRGIRDRTKFNGLSTAATLLEQRLKDLQCESSTSYAAAV